MKYRKSQYEFEITTDMLFISNMKMHNYIFQIHYGWSGSSCHCLCGKLRYLQHNCVGDTMVITKAAILWIGNSTILWLSLEYSGRTRSTTLATYILAHCVTVSSATMLFTVWDKQVLIFHKEWFWHPAPSQCWERHGWNRKHISLKFCKEDSAHQGLTYLPRTKWRPFHGRHFHIHFHEWKFVYFDFNFTAVCSYGYNFKLVCIGSGNGLAQKLRQAINWSNVDPVLWHIYVVPGGDELTAATSEKWWCIGRLMLQN